MTTLVKNLTFQQVVEQHDAIVEVYRLAFREPPYCRTEIEIRLFNDSFLEHQNRQGFKFIAAIHQELDTIIGIAYGYTCMPDQWWYDKVSESAGKQFTRTWLVDSFQVSEVAVIPNWQGQGVGGNVFDTLMKGLPHPRAVLSTIDLETPALKLYLSRGWHTLFPNFNFPNVKRPYQIMGKILRLEN